MLGSTEGFATEGDPGYPWFAVRVRSKYERSVALNLKGMGFEEFLPAVKVERQWSDRVKAMDELLFPGYVFCRVNPSDRLPVLKVRGVVHLVGFGGGPISIPDVEIERVRNMVESGLLITPCPFLAVGETVRIEKGPLAGTEGILESIKGRYRLVVSIQLLQRSISAEIERAWVSRAPTKGIEKTNRGSPPGPARHPGRVKI